MRSSVLLRLCTEIGGQGLGIVSCGLGLEIVSCGLGLGIVSCGLGLEIVSCGLGLGIVSCGLGLEGRGSQPSYRNPKTSNSKPENLTLARKQHTGLPTHPAYKKTKKVLGE